MFCLPGNIQVILPRGGIMSWWIEFVSNAKLRLNYDRFEFSPFIK